MQQENRFGDLRDEEISSALDIEEKPTSEKGTPSPEASGIFMKVAEDLKQKREEKQRFIEQATKEEEALKSTQIRDLMQRISGKKQMEVAGEAARKWQEYLELSEDLKASRQGETAYGGVVEKPLEAIASSPSETTFEHVDPREESGERPAMFNLAELARQEEEAKQEAARNQPPAQQAA